MQAEPSPPASPAPDMRASRPVLLIAIVVAAQLVAMVLLRVFAQQSSYLIPVSGLSLELLLPLTSVVFSQGIAISAWWLAMLVPHSQRSACVPLALVLSLTLLYSALPLYRAFSNFYTWKVLGEELWRAMAWWRFSSISLQLVCIGSPCYLLSRMGNLQLNRSGDLPPPTTFDINRILGLTVLIAVVFATMRWTHVSQPSDFGEIPSTMFVFVMSAVSATWIGIGWACLSWASATRSTRWIAMTIAVLILLNIVIAYVTYWLIQNNSKAVSIHFNEPKLLFTISYSLISCLGILAAIRVADYCGYRLVFSRFVGS